MRRLVDLLWWWLISCLRFDLSVGFSLVVCGLVTDLCGLLVWLWFSDLVLFCWLVRCLGCWYWLVLCGLGVLLVIYWLTRSVWWFACASCLAFCGFVGVVWLVRFGCCADWLFVFV